MQFIFVFQNNYKGDITPDGKIQFVQFFYYT